MKKTQFIFPDWNAPENILACTTTRVGGISAAPFDDFNLAMHVDDDLSHVAHNRLTLRQTLNLANEPAWLTQTHSIDAVELGSSTLLNTEADASMTQKSNQTCVVMTADCLPILLCHKQGLEVAAIHAGWRGLAKHIISKISEKLHFPLSEYLVWIGPAISQAHFEVGDDVKTLFKAYKGYQEEAFIAKEGKWLADLASMAEIELKALGFREISRYLGCTYQEKDRFFSYRRDGKTGRMATLITILG